MKKNVLIIGNIDYRLPGGIETKSRNIMKALFDVANITFLKTVKNPKNSKFITEEIEGVELIDISPKTNTYPFKSIYGVKKIIKKQNWDLIIWLSLWNTRAKFMFKNDKVVFVQSMDAKFTDFNTYPFADKIKLKLDELFLGTYCTKDPLLESKNVVFFTEGHVRKNSAKNVFLIQNPHNESITYIENVDRAGAFFAGRIKYWNKGLDFLKELHNKNKSIDVWGNGPDLERAKADFSENYKGIYSTQKLSDIAKNYRVFVSCSREEGFQNTASEALGAGLPIVMFDGLDQVDFFKKCEAVSIIKFGDTEAMNKEIKRISNLDYDEWEKLSNIAKSFAKKHLEFSAFKNSWINVLNTISEKK